MPASTRGSALQSLRLQPLSLRQRLPPRPSINRQFRNRFPVPARSDGAHCTLHDAGRVCGTFRGPPPSARPKLPEHARSPEWDACGRCGQLGGGIYMHACGDRGAPRLEPCWPRPPSGFTLAPPALCTHARTQFLDPSPLCVPPEASRFSPRDCPTSMAGAEQAVWAPN